MLSYANESLIEDGRSLSAIMQGVTLEVMGEGDSMGPLNDALRQERLELQTDIKYPISWNTLSEYLNFIVNKGISTNVGSFVGATTIRRYVLGNADRAPSPTELAEMQSLVREAMKEGALGIASALIYAPAFYAKTEELIALAQIAAEYGGIYCSHLRSEGNNFLEAIDELIEIAKQAKIRAEIYHLKAAGRDNWKKMDMALEKIEAARRSGLPITADMYMYIAAHTGLDAAMPPWVQEGGVNDWVERLRQPSIRQRLKDEIATSSDGWENGYLNAGPENIVIVQFKNELLKPLTGKTLSAIANLRNTDPIDTMIDLVIEDCSRVEAIFFWMSEENLRKQLKYPWISVGSDALSIAPEGVFLKSSTHPRTYGNVPRFLGKYVREEKLMTLQEGVRRLTSLPAGNLRLDQRGSLKEGYFADVVCFDAEKIIDRATFTEPHQYSTGMINVLVNGTPVLYQGEHTNAMPGQVVHGPGFQA
jgi:N-acyl-D-amino-acid deacylase